jgi:hypothetical protein
VTTYRLGCDASRVCTPAEVAALKATFVVRYFSRFPSKNITLSEAQHHTDAGMNIVSVYEDDVNDFEGGATKGVANAKLFVAESSAVRMPTGRPGYFAVDENVDPKNPLLHDYFRGISGTIGLAATGVYGSTAVCRELYRQGLVSKRWRSMSTGWLGGAGSDTDFDMEQIGYFNKDFDKDVALVPDFGQWMIGWSPIMNIAVVSLSIVDMCARNDPRTPAHATTNFNQVYPVQRGLAAEGCFDGKAPWVAGHWGPETISAYATWQGRFGYRGPDADGIPGKATLTALGAKHNFRVTA